ncbi:histidine kinase N-terminal domain-containing protein [Actinospica sp.]|jgi:two-component sensor histidine kinase|uniref:histidine kinase N-terminal domain-containing protein n=1 Tax=Actinospica sp. TaxID=1872142 RepID=UPI002C59D3CF|nr:histidine kinase N-terminal domain-containing protein [Actinospica sp.]HWG25947.1 histidine kinase N-terminal domain-containing protein [Actinospica sp.]
MPSMNDLVREQTALQSEDLEWLHLIVADWQIIADLSFADLVLWVPTADEAQYVAVAQMRPNTGPTSYVDDLVGHVVPRGRRPLLDQALDEGRIVREGDPEWREAVPVRVEAVPVRRGDKVIAVIARNTNLLTARTPSRLELTYLQTASDMAQMIATGRFPLPNSRSHLDAMPRVGDGMLRLDADGLVTYASPNAVSVFHRVGLNTELIGAHLGKLCADIAVSTGPTDEALIETASGRKARDTELANDRGNAMRLRSIPLRPSGERIGALVLVRDVTELRRRDRELMTKDATIREIHHRVKNNLQTVAALLRLQARRLDEPRGKAALQEAVRRVGSIAIVHETLSQTLDERVNFDEIADRVLSMVLDFSASGLGTTSGGVATEPVRPRRVGSFGVLGATVATPLAMVLTELLQNAFEHGLDGGAGTLLEVTAQRREDRLVISVVDDGRGLPVGFDPRTAGNLGLQIVRTLVQGELGGEFDMRQRDGGGTVVSLEIAAG